MPPENTSSFVGPSTREYDAEGRPLCFTCQRPQAAHQDGLECPVVGPAHRVIVAFDAPTEADWDTYGGAPTSEAALEVVRTLRIVPTASGGVQFELYVGGFEIEVEYDRHGHLESIVTAPVAKGHEHGGS
jgi:hypothetical protein